MTVPRSSTSSSSAQLQSPNAIPPRTSSTGYQNLVGHVPSKPALVPVREADWLSSRRSGAALKMSTPADARVANPDGDAQAETNGHGSTNGSRSLASDVTSTLPPIPPASDLAFRGISSWSPDKDKILMGPYEYLDAQPGKDIRRQLIAAFNEWLDVPAESLEVITRVVSILHTASLLVDDVEDSSLLRRGLPVAHSIFGTAQTINSANYTYFVALQELQKLRSAQAITIFTDELLNLHRGQGMDLFWRDTLTCPTEEDYLEMVGNKTGGLFRLAVKLMQAESQTQKDCVPLVSLMGIIFQIRDDYQNLSSPEYSHNKGLCEDLTEGKFSFPIIHSIRAQPANLQLLNILKQKTDDAEVKKYAVAYMESTGSFAYCRRVLATLMDRARRAVEDLDEGSGRGAKVLRILEKLSV